MPTAAPILKWVGGKASLAPTILPLLAGEYSEYHEPFVGGAGMLLAVLSPDSGVRSGGVFASDVNARLINFYQRVQESPDLVHADATRIIGNGVYNDQKEAPDPSRAGYYALRKAFNTTPPTSIYAAALFAVMNAACFRGVYRENSKGEFNVPYGNYAGIAKGATGFRSLSQYTAFAEAVKDVTFRVLSFDKVAPKKGSLVYADPPYVATFNGYAMGGFDHDAFFARIPVWQRAIGAKGKVVVSNSEASLPLLAGVGGSSKVFEVDDCATRRVAVPRKDGEESTQSASEIIIVVSGSP